MRWKRFLQYGGLLFLLLAGIVLIINRVSARPNQIPDPSLLAPAAVFPTAWSTGRDPMPPVRWQEGTGARLLGADLYNPAFRGSSFSSDGWGIGMTWHALSATTLPYLNQEASQYPTVVEAMFKYQTLSPGDSTTWGSLPFRGAIQTPPLTPTAWANPSPSADAQRAVCAVGTLDACELWYAWIRYGQYIYQVILLTPAHPMNELTFYQFIQDIDANIGAKYE